MALSIIVLLIVAVTTAGSAWLALHDQRPPRIPTRP